MTPLGVRLCSSHRAAANSQSTAGKHATKRQKTPLPPPVALLTAHVVTSTTLSTLPTLSSLTALPPALPPASSSRFSPPHGVALLASSPAPTRLLRLAALANCTALSQGLLLDLGVNPTFRQYISAASELLPRLRTCYPRHHRRSRYAAVGCATLTAPQHRHAAFHPSQCLHLYTATLSDPLGPTISSS